MRVCAHDGCFKQLERGSKCSEHRSKRRSPSSRVTGTQAWKRVRFIVLQRDGYACHYCGKKASAVDHVVPVSHGGDPLDPANLRASCTYCNSSKGAQVRNESA
jgi:5-methylcytosine-specific restriction endonuclease McrA